MRKQICSKLTVIMVAHISVYTKKVCIIYIKLVHFMVYMLVYLKKADDSPSQNQTPLATLY